MWKILDGELFQNLLVETPLWQEPGKYVEEEIKVIKLYKNVVLV